MPFPLMVCDVHTTSCCVLCRQQTVLKLHAAVLDTTATTLATYSPPEEIRKLLFQKGKDITAIWHIEPRVCTNNSVIILYTPSLLPASKVPPLLQDGNVHGWMASLSVWLRGSWKQQQRRLTA